MFDLRVLNTPFIFVVFFILFSEFYTPFIFVVIFMLCSEFYTNPSFLLFFSSSNFRIPGLPSGWRNTESRFVHPTNGFV